jgi:transketolase
VGSGYVLHNVLAAAEELANHKINCNVFDAYTLPLEANLILDASRKAKSIILCVEDNYVGGVGSEIAEAAAARGDIRVVTMAADRIPKSAKTADEVFAYVGVGLEQIVAMARSLSGR